QVLHDRVLGDADDGDPRVEQFETFADRIAAGEVLARHGFVDDADAWRIGSVGRCERTSVEDTGPGRVEIVRPDVRAVHGDRFARLLDLGVPHERAAGRYEIGPRRVRDLRQRLDPLE